MDKISKLQKPDLITWGPLAIVLIAIAIYFGGQIMGGILISFIPLFMGWNKQEANIWLSSSTPAQFLLYATMTAMTLALIYGFLRYRKANLASIGLIKPKLRDVGYALVGLGVYLVLYITSVIVLSNIAPGLDTSQEQQIGFKNVHATLELLLVFMSLVIFPPLMEEVLCRGLLYSGLRQKLSVWPAALLTSILFGVAHLQIQTGVPLLWIAAIDTFVLSMVLVYLRERTGSLWPSIGLHALKNSIAFVLLFVIKIPS